MNILIVDDDADDRELFCEVLKEITPSANCVVYDNGSTALTFLRESDFVPDYIFLDVFMSGMDGKECLLKMKSLKTIQNVPVIMYSGLDDANQMNIYKKLGASTFICKPSSLEALRNILATIVK
jgi:PleD family two-component response regulator